MQPSGTSTHAPWWELVIQIIAIAPILYFVLLHVFNDGHRIHWFRGRFQFTARNEITPPALRMRNERAGYVQSKTERFQRN